MRKHFDGLGSTLSLCCAAFLSGCTVTPGDDSSGQDSRGTTDAIVAGTRATAYPEAVLVDRMQDGKRRADCSGSLIAPRLVLTAAHCLADPNGSWRITAPYANGQTASSSSVETYDWTASPSSFWSEHDLGLIFLSTPITIARYPSIAQSALTDGATIVNVGRVASATLSKTDLYVGKSITIVSAAPVFPYDYVAGLYTERGDSGGPVMQPGTHEIVAVNSAMHAVRRVEYLARVDLVFDWIQTRIANQPAF